MNDRTGRVVANANGVAHHFGDRCDDRCQPVSDEEAAKYIWIPEKEYDLTSRATDEVPRRFILIRDEDETGISGTGLVAFGVVFPDGVTVTRWNSDVAQTCVWQSFDEVDAVHGHGGRTRIEWVDE